MSVSSVPLPQENTNPETLNGSSRDGILGRFKKILGIKNGSIRQDLQFALSDDSFDDGHFSADERMFLSNILALRDVRVEHVMVPRGDVDAVSITTNLAELLHLFRNAGHSRMPVFGDTLDDPRGMVHIKDVLVYMTKTADYKPDPGVKRRRKMAGDLDLRQIDLAASLEDTALIRPVLFVPPSMKASALLAKMQVARIQMALVIDEYGGTDGLVSMEDLVETIVGDIEDEHDEDEKPTIVAESETSFVADAKTDLDEVVRVIGPEFTLGEYSEDADTLGGLVYGLVGRIPIRGELIPAPGPFEIEVLEADPRRIKRLRIHRRRRKIGSKIATNRNREPTTSDPSAQEPANLPHTETPSTPQ
uniref:hemolysin family protein n=1 Tax=Pararhizobium sp. IMCC3301 TaxID=3067904 RepID=UPI00274074AE|nr:hemolysin family protein [Pararhizobium sp. IMCC3301]